ncbi:Regulatory protein SoxS [Clostridium sp. N3C]|uniref:AraC family transcriptional regulator n=1 Tax=Clostridium sp. N3C TaxID=1776758 RepID=UPI00092DEB78|nr:GyrI-like domain-containing protein [Clostridium sp. N3C]SCN21536.1 Regulatory protein SoxS [Clostridium sp. N3C]
MEWVTAIREAIKYMEDKMLTVKGPEEVADHVHMSPMYLQRGFQIMTGLTIGEYIRNRRLYLAAMELLNTDKKIIDIAFKYGYETPESFTKAFTCFHNASPSEVRKNKAYVKTFLPLRVSIIIQGGDNMDYTVEKKAAFKVIGFSREFSFDTAYKEIPEFWNEIFNKYGANMFAGNAPANAIEQVVYDNRIGEFGVCIDDVGKDGKFRYMIAGRYVGGNIPKGMDVYEIPEANWAEFKCIGPMPESMQTVNTQIWKEWLPGNIEYELAGKFSVEWYSSAGNTKDSDYQSAIWIPVKRK